MADSRQVESWTWYGFASLFTLCRFVSRSIRLGGVRYFEIEDYVMVLAFGVYTNVIVWVNIQEKHPHTNILPSTGTSGMSGAEMRDRVYGSKITFTIEESMVVLQMLCKRDGSLLRPSSSAFGVNHFAITFESSRETHNHLIMSFAFNISSDLLMLAAPISMLLQSQLPWKKYYCFAHPESILWIYWYVREASTAIIVTNVPHCYALPRKALQLEAFSSLVGSILKTKRAPSGKHREDRGANKHKVAVDKAIRHSKPKSSESTENIAANVSKPASTLQIWQRSEYSVNTNNTSEPPWEETELQQIWQGGLGTTAKVEAARAASYGSPRNRDDREGIGQTV
ncbi:UbiD family decarboxylase [Metarhizium acridum CQMa 102]|uniref:UbiD family decarboxylase n=1 Tax=Metarhizium acridum (strain CQMa 102) TaxID=655827 RepID=E9E6E5_METAQ|nr:UbiD family decarboxylase [Metarhizium acridum CQMa 102]EFY88549.1 UbiD family decarboxylase [Metarhizium acridum CQMa 102]